MYKCDNCSQQYETIKPMTDLSRLEPGDFVPDGECETCGACVFEVGGRADTLSRMESEKRKLSEMIAAAFPGVKFDAVIDRSVLT
jgi:hypothetical protein